MSGLLEQTMMVPRLRSDSKIGAIKQLVDRLYRAGRLNDSLSFLQLVLERENLGSTVIGGTIALPHARARSVTGLGMALGVCDEPIYYPSGDDLCAVRAVCVIAVPMDSPRPYLGLLSLLAGAFGDSDFVHLLLAAPSAREMSELMSARLSSAPVATPENAGQVLPADAALAGARPGMGDNGLLACGGFADKRGTRCTSVRGHRASTPPTRHREVRVRSLRNPGRSNALTAGCG